MKHKLLPLSETMHYILLALREPLHGYAAMQKIEKMSNGTVILAAGTLYGAIENLNKHGWIEPVGELGQEKSLYDNCGRKRHFEDGTKQVTAYFIPARRK